MQVADVMRPAVLQDIGVAEPPRWLTRAFSLLERDDLSVDLRHLHTLQKVSHYAHHWVDLACLVWLAGASLHNLLQSAGHKASCSVCSPGMQPRFKTVFSGFLALKLPSVMSLCAGADNRQDLSRCGAGWRSVPR